MDKGTKNKQQIQEYFIIIRYLFEKQDNYIFIEKNKSIDIY